MSSLELQKGLLDLLDGISGSSGLSMLMATRKSPGNLEIQLNNSGALSSSYPTLEEALFAITPEGLKVEKLKRAEELELKAKEE